MYVSQISYQPNVINNSNNISYEPNFQGVPNKSTLNKLDKIPRKFKRYILARTQERGISIESYTWEINILYKDCKELKENLTQLVESCHKDTTVDIERNGKNYLDYDLVFRNRNLPKSVQISRDKLRPAVGLFEAFRDKTRGSFLSSEGNIISDDIIITFRNDMVLSKKDESMLYEILSIIQLNQFTKQIIEHNKDGELSKKIDNMLYEKGRNITPCDTVANISLLEFLKRLYRAPKLDKLARDLNKPSDCKKTLLKTAKEHIINRVKLYCQNIKLYKRLSKTKADNLSLYK